jgi:ABC-type multidrug transport system fused ATPase/permease subunit
LLSLTPELTDPETPVPAPPVAGSNLVDEESGVVIRPGRLTAISAATPEEAAAIADRLGHYFAPAGRHDGDGAVSLGGVALADLDRATVRELVLVADNQATLFSGTLRDELGQGLTAGVDDERVLAALRAANAEDIIDALPDGLDAELAEGGREFSGGQQQRLRLARALLVDPPILVLIEPTSAVDAHTEARIAARLGAARLGRTTVICTTSPLVLDRADHVIYVESGRAVAEGTHQDLLSTHPAYAATVTRGEDE